MGSVLGTQVEHQTSATNVNKAAWSFGSLQNSSKAVFFTGNELPRDVLPGGSQPGGVPGPSAEAWPGRSHRAGQIGRRIWGGSRAEALPIHSRTGRMPRSTFSQFTGTNHSCLAFCFSSSPPWSVLWWGQFGLCLPGTYVSRRENANYLYLKIEWENMLFSFFFFFFHLADCLVVLTARRKIKTPSLIRHSRLVFVWVAI